MRNTKLSKSIFVSLLFIFYCLLFYSYLVLPENIAIHFSLNGEPNGWMSKTMHAIAFGSIGTFTSSLVIGSFYMIRHLPKDIINIPNRDYWLAPERFQHTMSDLMNYGIGFANVILLIFIGVGFLILEANKNVETSEKRLITEQKKS
jgi:serine/threonine-protein kinase